jgi:hypothetical protein
MGESCVAMSEAAALPRNARLSSTINCFTY